jgi:hypothetical protein
MRSVRAVYLRDTVLAEPNKLDTAKTALVVSGLSQHRRGVLDTTGGRA